jgi:hypothetical protein
VLSRLRLNARRDRGRATRTSDGRRDRNRGARRSDARCVSARVPTGARHGERIRDTRDAISYRDGGRRAGLCAAPAVRAGQRGAAKHERANRRTYDLAIHHRLLVIPECGVERRLRGT